MNWFKIAGIFFAICSVVFFFAIVCADNLYEKITCISGFLSSASLTCVMFGLASCLDCLKTIADRSDSLLSGISSVCTKQNNQANMMKSFLQKIDRLFFKPAPSKNKSMMPTDRFETEVAVESHGEAKVVKEFAV